MPFHSFRDLTGVARQVTDRLTEAGAEMQRVMRDASIPGSQFLLQPSGSVTGGVAEAIGQAFGAFTRPIARSDQPVEIPEGAQFLSASFQNAAGSRPYKLYIPARLGHGQVPLVVMLHGCTQSPDDFAAGTRMNQAAEEGGFLVCYPAQTQAANQAKCWNWFNTEDQARDRGEPSLIAGIVQQIIQSHNVDRQRVYVAGLSAGGAAAAIMGSTYPDLFAAIGVHSGLACGAAHDIQSAMAAMRQGAAAKSANGRPVPTIIFHGDRDNTVNPANAEALMVQSMPTQALHRTVTDGQVEGGHSYHVTTYADAQGTAVLEQWLVHGAGHAWSGGSQAGTFTDPKGPDATQAMLHFFSQHRTVPAGNPPRL